MRVDIREKLGKFALSNNSSFLAYPLDQLVTRGYASRASLAAQTHAHNISITIWLDGKKREVEVRLRPRTHHLITCYRVLKDSCVFLPDSFINEIFNSFI